MNHTPGPWKHYHPWCNSPGLYEITAPIGGEPVAAGKKIASFVSENNARLIAVAPDMLEALIIIEDQLESHFWDERFPAGSTAWALAVKKIVTEAIANAKGDK